MSRPECPACRRPAGFCYCSRIHRISNRWPVFILQDKREARHAIGTARIARLSLRQAEMVEINPDRDDIGDNILSTGFGRPLSDPVLIYPGEEAQPLSELSMAVPRDLLFIDAEWKRSRKFLHVFPELAGLPRFSLDNPPPSRYRIRKEPAPQAVSTLEAIVATLHQLEPEQDFSSLLATMDWMIDQQIAHMGANIYDANYISGR